MCSLTHSTSESGVGSHSLGRATGTTGSARSSYTKNALKLVIHKGALLADPRGVMEGEGRYSRAIAVRSPEEIDADVLAPILREAAARQTEM
jgi:hypothetical protein